MKKIVLFMFLFVSLISASGQEQVIVGWTFPGNSAVADTGIDVNLDKEIQTIGGTSAIEFKNGFTTKAAQATGWDDGMDVKAWMVSFSTIGYSNLTISSRQQSGGNEPGPKDFKIQYNIDEGITWIDITGGEITVENDWETSYIDGLLLPVECNDIAEVALRWIMTSNEASGAGGPILETGKSKIDDIYVKGSQFNGIEDLSSNHTVAIGPNPIESFVNIETEIKMHSITIFDLSGRIMLNYSSDSRKETIDVSALANGLYILTVRFNGIKEGHTQKILVN